MTFKRRETRSQKAVNTQVAVTLTVLCGQVDLKQFECRLLIIEPLIQVVCCEIAKLRKLERFYFLTSPSTNFFAQKIHDHIYCTSALFNIFLFFGDPIFTQICIKTKKKKTEYGASTGFYFVFLLVFQIYEGVLCYILI